LIENQFSVNNPNPVDMKAFCKHAGHQNTEPGNDVFASPAFVDPLKAALD